MIIKNIRKYIKIIIIILVVTLIMLGLLIKNNNISTDNNKIINIVFNTDSNYTEYTKVAIKSAILNKSSDNIYNIYILCVDLPNEKTNEFKLLNKNIKNVNIKTIPLSIDALRGIGDYEVKNYVTRTDLFKFLIPDIFPELDKILYIDSDTLILKDLSELYNTNINKYYIGAVKKYMYNVQWIETEDDSYGINKIYTYNCGVLLYNLSKWRKDNIKEKLIRAKNSDIRRDLVTQRSFNEVIPIKKIKLLSPIYNVMGNAKSNDFEIYRFKEIYKPYCDNINSYEELVEKAVIIHYANAKKPWSYTDLWYNDVWWKYARLINPDWETEPDTAKEKLKKEIL